MSHGGIGIIRTQNLALLIIALFFCLSTPCYALDVTFAWNDHSSATGYKFYYKALSSTSGPPYNGTGAEEGPSPIDVNNQTQFTLHNLSDGGYHFAVTAYNEYGESGYSTEVVIPPTYNPPSGMAELPFTENFERGDLAVYWEIHSTGTGRTLVTSSDDPHSGSYHLTMDSSQNGTYSLNELILTIDLSGQSGVILGFHHKEFNDEDHVMPDSFSGSHNSDGVAISPNGTTWYKVQGLTSADGISSGGTFYAVDLDSAITAWGLDYNSTFKIKFQHYDNYSIGDDGFAFDDVEVYQNISDADQDGLPDDWELFHFNNLAQEPEDDLDYDELNNLSEYQLGTKPSDSDSDSDGMLDGWEVRYDLDPIDAADADEDLDGDGQTNLEEHGAGTDPTLMDTGDDGGTPPPPPPTGQYELLMSSSVGLTAPVPLGSKTVSGDIYVYTSPDSGVERVTFYLDGSYHRTENFAPYDFEGSADSGLPNPFDTAELYDGQHEITAQIISTDGSLEEITANFTVANGDGSGLYQLLVSSSSSRSSAVPLDGKTVAGNVYVFTSPDAGITRVTFYLDGSYRRTENFAPYDFAGSVNTGLASPFDTSKLNDGQHEIRAVIDLANGGAEEVTGYFTVNN